MLKQFLIVLRAEKTTMMITMRFIVVRQMKITNVELEKNTGGDYSAAELCCDNNENEPLKQQLEL